MSDSKEFLTLEVHVCPEFLQGFDYIPQPNGTGLILHPY